jgi:hypothetical protein
MTHSLLHHLTGRDLLDFLGLARHLQGTSTTSDVIDLLWTWNYTGIQGRMGKNEVREAISREAGHPLEWTVDDFCQLTRSASMAFDSAPSDEFGPLIQGVLNVVAANAETSQAMRSLEDAIERYVTKV